MPGKLYGGAPRPNDVQGDQFLPSYRIMVQAVSDHDLNPRAPRQHLQPIRREQQRFTLLRNKEISRKSIKIGRGESTIVVVVYQGFDNVLGCHVAVKECSLRGLSSTSRVLADEFRMLRDLSHDRIVKVLDFMIAEDEEKEKEEEYDNIAQKQHVSSSSPVMRIVMEWTPGGSVADLMRSLNFRLHEASIRKFIVESLEGLAYLHSMGVVHGHVTPSNMLLDANGSVKLSDFGSELYTTQSYVDSYFAPPTGEERRSAASDVWAIGRSIVVMAGGGGENAEEGTRCPSCMSQKISEIVARCCEVDPAARPTAAELLRIEYFSEAGTPSTSQLAEMEPFAAYTAMQQQQQRQRH